MNASQRRAANEAAVRHFFATWNPSWRWLLVLGLRDLRENADHLGSLAADALGDASWRDDEHVYGPVSLALTASAVNEVSQHCEDLFALLTFLDEDMNFVKGITAYSAGRVTGLAPRLAH